MYLYTNNVHTHTHTHTHTNKSKPSIIALQGRYVAISAGYLHLMSRILFDCIAKYMYFMGRDIFEIHTCAHMYVFQFSFLMVHT